MRGSSAAPPASHMPHSFLAQDRVAVSSTASDPPSKANLSASTYRTIGRSTASSRSTSGLRWDMETGMTERYDRYAAFDPNVRSPLSDKVGLDLNGGYIFPNKGIDGRGLRSAQLGNIAPRIGIAYQIAPNTVIRTGYGIFYTMAPYGANNYGTAPFRASTPWLTSLDGVTPYNLLRNPYPDGVLVPEGDRQWIARSARTRRRSPCSGHVEDAVQPAMELHDLTTVRFFDGYRNRVCGQ